MSDKNEIAELEGVDAAALDVAPVPEAEVDEEPAETREQRLERIRRGVERAKREDVWVEIRRRLQQIGRGRPVGL